MNASGQSANGGRDRPAPRWPAVVAGVCLVAAVWAVYGRVLGHEFVGYDEQQQLVTNPLVRELSLANLGRLFTTPSVTSYYPFRTLSFAIDHAVWGLWPTGFHLTNLLLHTGNVLLVFGLAVRLLGGPGLPRPWQVTAGALGAGLFALHPVVVEPVAWVGGREELLMVLGVLACVHLHLSARRREDRAGRATGRAVACHVGAVLACIVACGSNVVGAVTPALVTAMDLLSARRPKAARILAATAPLWIVGAAAVVLKLVEPSGPSTPIPTVSPAERPAVVLDLYGLTLRTLLGLEELTVQYPWRVPAGLLSAGVIVGALALGATAAAIVLWRRPTGRWALAWFLIGLVPGLQVVPHHVFRADRLLYLPLAGLALAAGTALSMLRRPALRGFAAGLAGLALAGAAWAATVQAGFWRDGVALFSRAAEINPDSAVALNNLAVALAREGRNREAADALDRAVRVDPDDFDVRYNRAAAFEALGQTERAAAAYERALALRPDHLQSRIDLASALAELGRRGPAIRHLMKALEGAPRRSDARQLLAALLAEEGLYAEAIGQYEKVLAADPERAEAQYGLGTALAAVGRPKQALVHLRRVVEIDPGHVRAHNNLAGCLATLGRTREAAAHWERTIKLDAGHVPARMNLAALLAREGRFDRAVRLSEEALRLAEASGGERLIEAIRERLRHYRNARPGPRPEPTPSGR